jgi:hypothetical protein
MISNYLTLTSALEGFIELFFLYACLLNLFYYILIKLDI